MQSDLNSFAEMSSWTALAWYTVMKTAFVTKSMKNESFGFSIVTILKKFLTENA